MPKQTGSSVGLPGYAWNDKLHNYVDGSTGRMVKRNDINDLLREVTQGSEKRLQNYGMMAADAQMTPRQFYEAMQQEIKLLTNSNAALAKGGWAQMTPADWGRNGYQLRQEYANLRQFAQEIADGTLSGAQIEARAKLYANTTYARYWEIRTEQETAAGKQEERLVTSKDDRVCEECLAQEAMGWQPIGSYNPPIHAGCRCDVEYQ